MIKDANMKIKDVTSRVIYMLLKWFQKSEKSLDEKFSNDILE